MSRRLMFFIRCILISAVLNFFNSRGSVKNAHAQSDIQQTRLKASTDSHHIHIKRYCCWTRLYTVTSVAFVNDSVNENYG